MQTVASRLNGSVRRGRKSEILFLIAAIWPNGALTFRKTKKDTASETIAEAKSPGEKCRPVPEVIVTNPGRSAICIDRSRKKFK